MAEGVDQGQVFPQLLAARPAAPAASPRVAAGPLIRMAMCTELCATGTVTACLGSATHKTLLAGELVWGSSGLACQRRADRR